jgi:hypothetical protein
VNGTSLSSGTALTPGQGYTWYVGAVSTNGRAATYDLDTPQRFTLAALTAPTTMDPNGTIDTAFPVFSWAGVPGADHYDVVVVDTSSRTPVLAVRDMNVTDTSWTPPVPLISGHRYTWYVGAVSTTGLFEAFSSGVNFTVS